MEMIFGIVLLSIFFISIEKLFPAQTQKTFRTGWLIDVTHFFINCVVVQLGVLLAIFPLYFLLGWAINPGLQAAVSSQPGWLQFAEAFLIAEMGFYTLHRLCHELPWLWRFHAIHHTSPALDWLAALRFHPVELILSRIFVGTPLIVLGFSQEILGAYSLVSTSQALFIHANLKLEFPILRWLIATPEFHRWHHNQEPETQNKNFGQPFLDLLFGTLYIPKHNQLASYGVNELMLNSYKEQLLYPFQSEEQRQISLIESTSQQRALLDSSMPESPIHR
jgi:sterol desaturase/sphingolipid hydroxylase (fatty acid hydroxylase superfamily)